MSEALARELDALLESWRSTFDEKLGARIEALGAALPGFDLALTDDVEAAANTWCTAATDASPASLTSLLKALGELSELLPASRVASCLELVAARQPDPRLATFALPYLLGQRPVPELTHRLYGRLLSVLQRHGDLRAARALGAWLGTAVPRNRLRVRTVKQHIEHRVAAAARTARAFADHVDRAAGDALLAAVYDDPDDDGRRLVYADWLLERDPEDPRGQLIATQIHRQAKRASGCSPRPAIVKALDDLRVTRHAREWYAAILPAIEFSSMVFENGFLAGCTIARDVSLPAAVFARPEWSTVRAIRLGPGFHYTPAMRSLRTLTNVREHELHRLATADVAIPRLDRLDIEARSQHLGSLVAFLARTHVSTVAATASDVGTVMGALNRARHGPVTELELRRCDPSGYWTWQVLDRSSLRRLVIPRDTWSESRLELLRDEGGWTKARVFVDEGRSHQRPPHARSSDSAWSDLLGFLCERRVEELELVCIRPPQLPPLHPLRRLAERCAHVVRDAG